MNLEIFKNSGFELRGGLLNGEPYFLAKDVCKYVVKTKHIRNTADTKIICLEKI